MHAAPLYTVIVARTCSDFMSAVLGPGRVSLSWFWDVSDMASALSRAVALLVVTTGHASASAGVLYRQQLVAVARTAGAIDDPDVVDAAAGYAGSVHRHCRTAAYGASGSSSSALAVDYAAAVDLRRIQSPPCAASEGGYPLGGRLVERSAESGSHRLHVGIGVSSALDRMSDHDAAACQAKHSIHDAPTPHAISASSTARRSLVASSEVSDGFRKTGAVLAINSPTAGAHKPRDVQS
jgi:hypothetical protein